MAARIFIWFLVAFLPFLRSFAAETVKGRVFVDLNGNGIYDAGEPGVAGAKISDGEKIVLTNFEGQYTMEVSPDATHVFLCLPAGFKPLHSFRGAKERFWKTIEEVKTNGNICDFPLQKDTQQERFSFIHLSDSHGFWAFSSQEVINWALKKLLTLAPEDFPIKFIASTGDDPCDSPTSQRICLEKSILTEVGVPWLQVPGNHEFLYTEKCYDFDLAVKEFGEGVRDWSPKESFEQNFGPTYFSLDCGEVHFVFVNSQDWSIAGTKKFDFGVSERQLKWLMHDLELVPKEKFVVVFCHWPWGPGEKNWVEYLKKLSEFPKRIVLLGHGHDGVRGQMPFGVKWEMIPAWTMGWWCGYPRMSVGIYIVKGGEVEGWLEAFPEGVIGEPPLVFLNLAPGMVPNLSLFHEHMPEDLGTTYRKMVEDGGARNFEVIVGYYGREWKEAKVFYSFDGRQWKEMERLDRPDVREVTRQAFRGIVNIEGDVPDKVLLRVRAEAEGRVHETSIPLFLRIEGVEGEENLLPNGGFEKGLEGWKIEGEVKLVGDGKPTPPSVAVEGKGRIFLPQVELDPGAYYVLLFWVNLVEGRFEGVPFPGGWRVDGLGLKKPTFGWVPVVVPLRAQPLDRFKGEKTIFRGWLEYEGRMFFDGFRVVRVTW